MSKETELRYHYTKMLLASQIIFEMQLELKASNVFNGKSKNAARILVTQSKYNIKKDIENIFGRDSEIANTVIQSIEDIAQEVATLDTHKLGNVHHILKQIQKEGCMLIDRDYYEELEKIKVKYNKL